MNIWDESARKATIDCTIACFPTTQVVYDGPGEAVSALARLKGPMIQMEWNTEEIKHVEAITKLLGEHEQLRFREYNQRGKSKIGQQDGECAGKETKEYLAQKPYNKCKPNRKKRTVNRNSVQLYSPMQTKPKT